MGGDSEKFNLLSAIHDARKVETINQEEIEAQRKAKNQKAIDGIIILLTSALTTLTFNIKNFNVDLKAECWSPEYGRYALFDIYDRDAAEILYYNIKELRPKLMEIVREHLGDGVKSIVMDVTCKRPYERIIKRPNLTLIIGSKPAIEDRKPEYQDDFWPEDNGN